MEENAFELQANEPVCKKRLDSEVSSQAEVAFLNSVAQLLYMYLPADANNQEEEPFEHVEARCSHCSCICIHNLVERNNIRKDEYRCSSCSERTCKCLKFDDCRGAAKSNFLWDDALCTLCDHVVEKFASGDITIQTLVDELQLQAGTTEEPETPNPVPEITEEVNSPKADPSFDADAAIQLHLAVPESIEAFCSHCATTSTHRLVERNRARKDEYTCTSCSERTCKCLKYSICHGAAKSNFLWDDALCTECDRQFSAVRAEHDRQTRRDYENAGDMSRTPSLEEKMLSSDIVISLQKALQEGSAIRREVPRPLSRISRRRANDVLEDWEVLRDALLSFPGPERADVDKYRRMCTHKVWLKRWIIGSENKPSYAMRRILVHLKWRQEYGLDTIMDEDWSAFDARKEMYVAGVDREGRPTWTWNCSVHDAGNQSPEMAARYLICTMERAWAVNPQANRVNVLCNCRNMSYSNYEHQMFLICLAILSEQYPDNLQANYMFPVSWVIHAVMAAGSHFMSQDTLSKLILASESDLESILGEHFAADQIEPQFGGSLDPAAAVKRRLLDEDPEMRRAWEEEETYAAEHVRPTRAVRALQLAVMPAEARERLLAGGYDDDARHFGAESAAASELSLGSELPVLERAGSPPLVSEEDWSSEADRDSQPPSPVRAVAPPLCEESSADAGEARPDNQGARWMAVRNQGSRLVFAAARGGAEFALERAGVASACALDLVMQAVWAVALVAANALKRAFLPTPPK